MQINDGNLLGANRADTSQTQRAGLTPGNQSAASGAKGKADDAVELSSFAQQINNLQEGSESREARVAQLRSLYLSGAYEIDPAALAQSIVSEHIRG